MGLERGLQRDQGPPGSWNLLFFYYSINFFVDKCFSLSFELVKLLYHCWELGVRFSLYGSHWCRCQKLKMMQCAFFTVICENKKFHHGAFLFSTLLFHLTELSTIFQKGCFNFAQMKASVEPCINKLSDSDTAAKPELKSDCKRFKSELGEHRTPDDLADLCVKWHACVLEGHRKIGKLTIPIDKKGDRSECTNYRGRLSS